MAKIVERRDLIDKVHRAKVYLDPVRYNASSSRGILVYY